MKVGDFFTFTADPKKEIDPKYTFILAMVDSDYNKGQLLSSVCLVCIDGGNRWSNPVYVKDNMRITKDEWSRITRGSEDDYWKNRRWRQVKPASTKFHVTR
jgi:hypothetical protein